jgi:plastocyanin
MPRKCVFRFAAWCALTAACGGGRQPEQSPAPAAAPAASSVSSGGYETIVVSDGGSLSGTISVSGPIPALPPRPINKNPEVCGSGVRPSQELMVGSAGGLKNALVIVEGVRRGKAMPAMTAKIDQVKCEYEPHVQVMAATSDITIVNSDPILHNIHFYQGSEDLFNIAQPLKGQSNAHAIQKTGFVYAECDVHGWMRGHVAVVDNPYFAVTDENGKFSIADLPAGGYTVRIWHEYLGERTQPVTVNSKADTPLNVDLRELLSKKQPPSTQAAPAAKPEVAAAAASTGPKGVDANALSGEVTVRMVSEGGSFRYEPAAITVRAGTTVKWVNESDNRHSATDDPKFEKAAGMAILPAGGAAWTTPFIGNGDTAAQTFAAPGKYQYFCRNHGQFGMVGTISVVR